MKTKKNTPTVEQTPLESNILEGQNRIRKQVSEKIDEYENLITGLPSLLTAYSIEVKKLSAAVNIARGTFYNRVKAKDFPPSELRKVYKYIETIIKTQEASTTKPINAPKTPEPPQDLHTPQVATESGSEHAKTATNDSSTSQPAPRRSFNQFRHQLEREKANEKKNKNTN